MRRSRDISLGFGLGPCQEGAGDEADLAGWLHPGPPGISDGAFAWGMDVLPPHRANHVGPLYFAGQVLFQLSLVQVEMLDHFCTAGTVEPDRWTRFRDNPGGLGGTVLTLEYCQFYVGISKADIQIPSTYFSIAKIYFSIAKVDSQVPSTYFSIAFYFSIAKSRFFSNPQKGRTQKRTQHSYIKETQGLLWATPFARMFARTFVQRRYLRFDVLGTTSNNNPHVCPDLFALSLSDFLCGESFLPGFVPGMFFCKKHFPQ